MVEVAAAEVKVKVVVRWGEGSRGSRGCRTRRPRVTMAEAEAAATPARIAAAATDGRRSRWRWW